MLRRVLDPVDPGSACVDDRRSTSIELDHEFTGLDEPPDEARVTRHTTCPAVSDRPQQGWDLPEVADGVGAAVARREHERFLRQRHSRGSEIGTLLDLYLYEGIAPLVKPRIHDRTHLLPARFFDRGPQVMCVGVSVAVTLQVGANPLA